MRSMIGLLLLVAAGCAGNPSGAQCGGNAECASALCMHSKCTRLCAAQTDCPVGFDCGLADPADSQATCYKRTWDQPATGGFLTDCSTVSADPKTGKVCDAKATSPCAPGFACQAAHACDPGAYCTKGCATDLDCPASMFCGTLPKGKPTCLKRAYCDPCATDDECATGQVCATDPKGARYCAKLCDPTKINLDHNFIDCPLPQNDNTSGSVNGNAFEKCVTDPTTTHAMGTVSVCAPTKGFCHGPSAVASVMGDASTCSPCRAGFPGDCGAGLTCYFDEFSTERFCTKGCSIHFTKKGGSYTTSMDSCQALSPDLYCVYGGDSGIQQSCITAECSASAPCDAGSVCTRAGAKSYCFSLECDGQGLCAADPNYIDATCYPLPM